MVEETKQCGTCGMCHGGKCCRGIAWSGIFAGAFVAIGLSILINLLLASIGISLYTPSSEGLKAMAIVGYIVLLIVAFVVMYIGGFVSGHLGGGHHSRACGGLIYGFTTWSLALIIAALLASGMGSSVAGSQPLVNTAIINLPSGSFQALGQGQKVTAGPTAKAPATTAQAGKTQTGTEEQGGMMTQDEKTIQHYLGTSLFLTFLIFLVGAIGACIGGAVGNRTCRKYEYRNDEYKR